MVSEIRRCEPVGGSALFEEEAKGRCSVKYVMVLVESIVYR